MRTDRTVGLFVVALLIAVFSYGLFVTSVHTYCENRWVAAVFASTGLATLVVIVRNNAATLGKKVLSGTGASLCLLSVAFNLLFIVVATRDCSHMFDQLK